MRTQATERAYAAVGAADVATEKVREGAKTLGKTARRTRRGAERTIVDLEKRGRKVIGSSPRAKRVSAKTVSALRSGRAKPKARAPSRARARVGQARTTRRTTGF